MHILLTDILSCPRCGPEHGLILLANRIEARRVLDGWLGCAECREQYRIAGGFADLRVPPAAPLPGPAAAPPPARREEAFGLVALLGVMEGPGFVLIAGPAARLATGVAAIVEGLEVIAAEEALAGWTETSGVSRIAASPALPFYSGRLRAVALSGEAADRLLEEGARALSPVGRLVLWSGSGGVEPDARPDTAADVGLAGAEQRLAEIGFRALAREGETLVAERA